MNVAQVIELLQGFPQNVELVVKNVDDRTVHKTVGIHVYPTEGVVAMCVVNRSNKVRD